MKIKWEKVVSKKAIGIGKTYDATMENTENPSYIANNFIVHNSLHSGLTADYVLRHKGKKPITYEHPILEPITKETKGIICYQEQIMQIMYKLGGFSWSTAESARKIISKSKGKDAFNKLRKEFVENSHKNHGLPREEAEKIFNNVSTFGSYSYNKIHAVEYSIISYWTAWLKTYYPSFFFTELLSKEEDDNQISNYIRDAKYFGITVKAPDLNESKIGFKRIDDKTIIAGFNAIKGIGKRTAKKIIKNQPFSSYSDFIKKAKPSKTIIEGLALSGGFDSFKIPRKEIYECSQKGIAKNMNKKTFNLENEWKEKERKMKMLEVISMPQGKPVIDYYDMPFKDKIDLEKIGELHFDDFIQERWIKGMVTFINFKQEGLEGQWALFDAGLERRYAHLNINDGTGNVLVHLSPEMYTYYKKILERGKGIPVLIKGHSIKNYQKIYCDALIVLDNIDNDNPIIKFLNNRRLKEKMELKTNFPKSKVGVIKNVTYKVSKKNNPYARIMLYGMKNYKDALLCFKLSKKIFSAGEVIAYTSSKKPFIKVIDRK